MHSIDAPVSGGDVGAMAGRVITMTGGDKEAIDNVRPLLGAYCFDVAHMGSAGAGQSTKLVNQMMIANILVGTCEALVFGHKSGLDVS